MSLEIEKKFLIYNFDKTIEELKKDFGDYKFNKKSGYWWCNNYDDSVNMLDIDVTKIYKKEVEAIKDIGEFMIPAQDFQFARLRILNNNKYVLTFKTKSLVNNTEENMEYEFDVDKEMFKRVLSYLEETSLVFYYNVKSSWKFKDHDVNIEISKFNDLKDAYIEIEALGKNNKELFGKIKNTLVKMSDYNMNEETRNYVELSYLENKDKLKRMKLSAYSRIAVNLLKNNLE